MRAKANVGTPPVQASAVLRHRLDDASMSLSQETTANVVNDNGVGDLKLAPGMSTFIGAFSGTNFNQPLNLLLPDTTQTQTGSTMTFSPGAFSGTAVRSVNTGRPDFPTQTNSISQSPVRLESLDCPHDKGPETDWPVFVEISTETPEHKAPNCSRCGGRLKRIHRSFFQRLLYDRVYRCQECLKQESIPRH